MPSVGNIAVFGQATPLSSSLVATFGYIGFTEAGSEVITDHYERAINRLAEQFKRKPDLLSLIKGNVDQIQELEYVFDDLKRLRSLNDAAGEQLDGLGDILGLEREGMNDEEYRNALWFQTAVNTSNGEPEMLISVLLRATDATEIIYIDLPPAGIYMFTNGHTVPAGLQELMESVAAGGVRLELVSSVGAIEPFAFAEEAGIPDPDGLGFGETTFPDEGGPISEKIT